MSSTKAKLTIILKADETIVAEIEDNKLWQKVLLAIHSGESDNIEVDKPSILSDSGTSTYNETPRGNNTLSKLANQIEVAEVVLKAAISPSNNPPYLHLDRHCWEALKKQTPSRGRGAIGPTAMAATLLVLWFNEAGLGSVVQSQALQVLKGIGIFDKNPLRGIKASSWLQSRPGGVIVINPAEISYANKIAKSFCTKNWGRIEENK